MTRRVGSPPPRLQNASAATNTSSKTKTASAPPTIHGTPAIIPVDNITHTTSSAKCLSHGSSSALVLTGGRGGGLSTPRELSTEHVQPATSLPLTRQARGTPPRRGWHLRTNPIEGIIPMLEYPHHWLTRLHAPVPGGQVIAGSYPDAVAAGLAAAVELYDRRTLLGEHDRALRAEVVVDDELAVFIPGTRTPGHDQDHNRDRLV